MITKGRGSISLVQGIKDLVSKVDAYYVAYLIGSNPISMQHKQKIIQTVLPHADINLMLSTVDTAYLLGEGGFPAATKKALSEKLKVEAIKIENSVSKLVPRM